MSDAVPEIMHSLLSLFLFVISVLTLFSRVDLQQELVETFSETNIIRSETSTFENKSEYHDSWNGDTWDSPKISKGTDEILNAIRLVDVSNVKIFVNSIQIPENIILEFKSSRNADKVISYLNNDCYIEICDYNENNELIAIRYQS